jgi:glycosyltransferase involved in cell wall biosynthesis
MARDDRRRSHSPRNHGASSAYDHGASPVTQLPSPAGDGFNHMFTVFTPTANRATTLHRVYDSLRAQTLRDFEWLIVDDGSTDSTEELVRGWTADAAFPIRYLRQEHGNKHVATNHGVREARGRFFLTLDSDDSCVPRALERFKAAWDSIPADRRDGFAGVTALCVDEVGRLIGDRFPYDPTDSNPLELRFGLRVGGEKWGFQRTDVMRRFPFPGEHGSPRPPEGIVWDAIGRQYQTRYINEALRVYWQDQSDRLTTPWSAEIDVRGALLALDAFMANDTAWFRRAPVAVFMEVARHVRFSLHGGRSYLAQWHRIGWPERLLWMAAVPVGTAMFGVERLGLRGAASQLRARFADPRR